MNERYLESPRLRVVCNICVTMSYKVTDMQNRVTHLQNSRSRAVSDMGLDIG